MSSTVEPLPWPVGWPAPNYENPETRGHPSIFIVTSVLTTIVVGLRLYSRHYLLRSVGIDDALLFCGYVGALRFLLDTTNTTRYFPLDRLTHSIKPLRHGVGTNTSGMFRLIDSNMFDLQPG